MRVTLPAALILLLPALCNAQVSSTPPAPATAIGAGVTVSFLPLPRPPLNLTEPPGPSIADRQQQAAPPPPKHTGFRALLLGTVDDFVAFPQRRSTWALLAIGAAGAAASHPIDGSVNRRLVGNSTVTRLFTPGKYLGGWVQAGAGITTYLVGRFVVPAEGGKGHNNKISHLGFDLVRAQILAQVFTQVIKKAGQRDRPTGECCAFPSGHSATAFATAAVLERHLGFRGAWPTMLIASYVATSRLHDNRHYLSDVVFGAALGTAVGWTVVGRHGRSVYALVPVPTRGGITLNLIRSAPRRAEVRPRFE